MIRADASRRRYAQEVRTRKAVDTLHGCLQFSTVMTWCIDRIVVHERHELEMVARTETAEQEFSMLPWTVEELHERLGAAGFTDVRTVGGTDRGTGDRLICTAVR